MTDAELQTVREKLNPYFVPYSQKPKNYKVTNSKKVQPDMWVKDVSKSIVLQVSGSPGQQGFALCHTSGHKVIPSGIRGETVPSGQQRFVLCHISGHKVISFCVRGETVPSVTVTMTHSDTQ